MAWERARQAAIATGLAEGTYYPTLVAAATGAVAHVPAPIPTTVVPGGVFKADTQFVIPALSLEWVLLDFGRRSALVDAAQAQAIEAIAGFNGKQQQIVFAVTRDFYALTRGARQGRRRARGARPPRTASRTPPRTQAARARDPARSAAGAKRRSRARPTTSRTPSRPSTTRAWRCSRAIGVRPGTPIEIADVSQQPLPPALEESVDEAIDRALTQRPDLVARLASVRAKEAEVRKARADYWPRLLRAVGGRRQHRRAEGRGQRVSGRARAAVRRGAALRVDALRRLRAPQQGATSPSRRRRKPRASWSTRRTRRCARCGRRTTTRRSRSRSSRPPRRCSRRRSGPGRRPWSPTSTASRRFPTCAKANSEVWPARARSTRRRAPRSLTRAAAFAFSTGDLARP